jgi:DNA-binding response OmpR family regulator
MWSSAPVGVGNVVEDYEGLEGPVASRGTCLVIEDDQDVRGVIRFILSREGFDVREAAFGAEGIRAAADPDVVLITLDLGLPDMDGHDVAAMIGAVTNVPLIFVTARADTGAQLAGMATGAAAYLIKPFRPAHLTALANQLCPVVHTPS